MHFPCSHASCLSLYLPEKRKEKKKTPLRNRARLIWYPHQWWLTWSVAWGLRRWLSPYWGDLLSISRIHEKSQRCVHTLISPRELISLGFIDQQAEPNQWTPSPSEIADLWHLSQTLARRETSGTTLVPSLRRWLYARAQWKHWTRMLHG